MSSRVPKSYVFPKALPPAAIAAFRKLRGDDKYPDIEPVLRAVDYPVDDPVGPLASTLTPAQRAAIEVLTDLEIETNNNDVDHWFPRSIAERRRWLGIDPPGPLQKQYTFTLAGKKRTEPGWRALKLLKEAESADDHDGEELVAKWLKSLPIADRLAMWGVVNLSWPQVWDIGEDDFFDGNDDKLIKQLGPSVATWAKRYADELLAARTAGATSKAIPLVPFLALVKAKVPIEPRWDALLPIMSQHYSLIKAIPAERRGSAVADALTQMGHPGWALGDAKRLLPMVPDPAIARYAIECIKSSVGSPRQHLADLAKAAAKHPAVLAVIEAARSGKPAPIELRTIAERDVAKEGKKATFSKTDEAQLLVSAKRYFGKKVPLATLLSLDPHEEQSLRPVLSVRTIANDKNVPVYDVWEYAGDSGTVFKTGTTKAVADIIQGSVECSDEALGEALEHALHGKAAKKTKKTTKPKTATKKPTARAKR